METVHAFIDLVGPSTEAAIPHVRPQVAQKALRLEAAKAAEGPPARLKQVTGFPMGTQPTPA
jgi:hypothetical protein